MKSNTLSFPYVQNIHTNILLLIYILNNREDQSLQRVRPEAFERALWRVLYADQPRLKAESNDIEKETDGYVVRQYLHASLLSCRDEGMSCSQVAILSVTVV